MSHDWITPMALNTDVSSLHHVLLSIVQGKYHSLESWLHASTINSNFSFFNFVKHFFWKIITQKFLDIPNNDHRPQPCFWKIFANSFHGRAKSSRRLCTVISKAIRIWISQVGICNIGKMILWKPKPQVHGGMLSCKRIQTRILSEASSPSCGGMKEYKQGTTKYKTVQQQDKDRWIIL